ncbi:MAG: toll/interleukin-1 receptor domain-containing protein [Boseongicola sp. SB0676_bin_33]|uniref:Toll/interleukin-1 receptor domain-containing protein n=1 Tax=Boseongicola sp. SB0664_bin_43 TaxID=2604844 RepID=A0A6B0XZ51_9RHOB|nr:toll/interleukin-1 receptor domain-containing protein [Boseongicola sp. SB0664_bin_43]MYF89035.1 toll/interleukin-1 receptor domain-containing protein [Boseongicola sp. SB0676_bin_33]MYK31201.1 toll/interleukin-1 receptor domain-containing protein [Boseongicola sp. SB0670_bin_30]
MARLFMKTAGERETSLREAVRDGVEWDVFVSHKSDDTRQALDLARVIQREGLSSWVDVLDPNVAGDGRELDDYIERVLSRTFSLLALVTDVTHESWWVPFEIGLAFELRRYLSSFADRNMHLPSFLQKHPRLATHQDLRHWCARLNQLKKSDRPERVLLLEGRSVMAEDREAYLRAMRQLTADFR